MDDSLEKRIEKSLDKIENIKDCPLGYLEIKLSTKGKYGAPEVFHVRNFSVEDMVGLSTADESELISSVIDLLNGVILEEDVKVENFHHKEVIETLLLMFKVFYSQKMDNLNYELDETDYSFLEEKFESKESPEYKKFIKELNNSPAKYSIDLNSLSFYDVDENALSKLKITNKRTGFSCVFSYPRFGDVLLAKKLADEVFFKEDKKFAELSKMFKFRNKAEEDVRKGQDIDLSKIPNISEKEYKNMKAYEVEKMTFMTTTMRAIHLDSINDEYVKDKTLRERLEIIKNPNIDYKTYEMVLKKFDSFKLGVKEEMTVWSPIQNRPIKRNISFRLHDILQAFQYSDSDEIDIELV